MRFPHHARIFRGQFDAAPYVGVFFLLVLFLLLGSSMVFLPGVTVQLPEGADLPGTDKPVAIVAVDEGGTFYFENQMCDQQRLLERLRATVERSPQPLTLVARMDKRARGGEVILKLYEVARAVGISELLLEVRPLTTASPR